MTTVYLVFSDFTDSHTGNYVREDLFTVRDNLLEARMDQHAIMDLKAWKSRGIHNVHTYIKMVNTETQEYEWIP